MTVDEAKKIANDEFGVKLDCEVTKFDIEQSKAIIYDILGSITCGCINSCLDNAIVYHLINSLQNNPEKDTATLKNELGSYLRYKGFYPSVRY